MFLVDFELYTDSAFSEFIMLDDLLSTNLALVSPTNLHSNGGSHTIALKIEPLHNVCKHFKKNDVVRMYTKSSDICFIVSVLLSLVCSVLKLSRRRLLRAMKSLVNVP